MTLSEKDQVRPLAPAAWRISSDEDETRSLQAIKLRQRKYALCCGCTTAVLLVIAVVLLVLGFTVLHVKEPKVHVNQIFLQRLELDEKGNIRTDVNVTLLADVSVKNPNAASFRFGNTTTTIYYVDGTVVGEGRNPAGKAKARRTLRMNMTVDMVPARMVAVPGLVTKLVATRAVTFKTYTEIDGRVKIASVVKKRVEVKLNCTATFNIDSRAIQEQTCKQKVSL